MKLRLKLCAALLLAMSTALTGADAPPGFRIQLDTIHRGYDGDTCWVHPRAGAIPGAPSSVVLTMQKLMLKGSDVFFALNEMRTDDLGKTWRGPTEHGETLGRRNEAGGVVVAACDFWPKWHAKSGKLLGIVEHKDCTPEQRKIREINPSYYCYNAADLLSSIARIDNKNAKGEYYITDTLGLLIRDGKKAVAITAVPPEDVFSINSRQDLALVNRIMRDRILGKLMDEGVTIVLVRFLGLARPVARYADRLASHDLALRALGRIRSRVYERIEPLAPGRLEAYAVSKAVSSVKNNGPHLVDPLPPDGADPADRPDEPEEKTLF